MQETVRDATQTLIDRACQVDNPVIVEAPPASGKTYNAVRLAAEPFQQVLYLAGRTDLYEQALEEARELGGIRFETIPSPHRDCDTFADENNGDTEKARRMYAKGASGEKIHHLGWDTVYMPCHTDESPCSYITKVSNLKSKLDDIDLLIGNHQHAYNRQYLKDRIVLFDEFNPSPFISRYPSSQPSVKDDPSEIIETFVTASEGLPFDDITDLIEARAAGREELGEALDWFRQNGATTETVEEIVTISPHEYNTGHNKSALLTCALLVMEKVGPGMELAWEPELWEEVGLNPDVRCIRDRNTGEMMVLEPPALGLAEQVIGLDALPVKRLWEVVFGCEFERYQVTAREKLGHYLEEGLGIEVIQLANGMNHYSSGRISSRDKQRLQVIRTLEGRRYPIITRKRALSKYRTKEWFDDCIERRDGELRAQHYATVLSSNVFEDDSLGLVSGSPYPGDHVVKRWAALCGESTKPERSEDSQNSGYSLTGFSGFGDDIYRHFTHHQVFQAILRFGRSEKADDDVTVYLNTRALPEWLTATELRVHDRHDLPRLVSILEVLIGTKLDDESPDVLTIKELHENACERLSSFYGSNKPEKVSEERVRQVVSEEEISRFIDARKSDRKYKPRVFEWTQTDVLCPFINSIYYADHILAFDSKIVLLQLSK